MMPWCPCCHDEFREGFTKCNDCGAELVDNLPQQDVQPVKSDDEATIVPVLLISTDSMQAQIAESILRDAGIPCYSKNRGTGGYLKLYMGFSIYGTDVFVNQCDYDRAYELIQYQLPQTDDHEDDIPQINEEDDNSLDDDYAQRSYATRKRVMRIVIGLMLIPVAITLISTSWAWISYWLRIFLR